MFFTIFYIFFLRTIRWVGIPSGPAPDPAPPPIRMHNARAYQRKHGPLVKS